jgi:hypothetical protein
VVLGALAVADNPPQVPVQLRSKLVGRVGAPAQPFGGIKPDLDALGEVHFLLGGEQGDLADLLQIRPHRIG